MSKNEDAAATRQLGSDARGRLPDASAIATRPRRKGTERKFARLVVVDGPGIGKQHGLFAGTNSIGRASETDLNDVGLDHGDDGISSHQHFAIDCNPSGRTAVAYDIGGKNPVHVNGHLVIGERKLSVGDVIALGITALRFDWDPPTT